MMIVDKTNLLLKDMDYVRMVLEGKHFIGNHLWQDISSGNSVYLYVKPNSSVGTLIRSVFFNAEGDLLVNVYVNPSISSNGTAISIQNANDAYPRSPSIAIYDGPSWNNMGTLVEQAYLSGTGTQMHPVDIFKMRFWRKSTYLIAIENVSGSNLQYLSVTFDMYEGVD